MNASFTVKEEIPMCPICMDDILSSTNNVKTECGHEFHTNCLMQNVAHNGFGCPCCRAKMAEEVDDDEDEDEDEDEDLYNTETYTLNTMRWMFQRENGEEVDDEDDYDEDDDDSYDDDYDEDDSIFDTNGPRNEWIPGIIDNYTTHTHIDMVEPPSSRIGEIPETDYLIQKLKEKGITYNDLVSSCLIGITWLDGVEWSEQSGLTDAINIQKKIADTTADIIHEYLVSIETEVNPPIKPEEKLGHFLSNRFYNVV